MAARNEPGPLSFVVTTTRLHAGIAVTVVLSLAILLSKLGSVGAPAITTEFVITPASVGITSTVKLELDAAAKLPMGNTSAPWTGTVAGEADTNVTPAGRRLVTATLVAAAGPLFFTVTV